MKTAKKTENAWCLQLTADNQVFIIIEKAHFEFENYFSDKNPCNAWIFFMHKDAELQQHK